MSIIYIVCLCICKKSVLNTDNSQWFFRGQALLFATNTCDFLLKSTPWLICLNSLSSEQRPFFFCLYFFRYTLFCIVVCKGFTISQPVPLKNLSFCPPPPLTGTLTMSDPPYPQHRQYSQVPPDPGEAPPSYTDAVEDPGDAWSTEAPPQPKPVMSSPPVHTSQPVSTGPPGYAPGIPAYVPGPAYVGSNVNTAVVLTQPTTSERPNFTPHIIASCLVTWCCNFVFGLIAFSLASTYDLSIYGYMYLKTFGQSLSLETQFHVVRGSTG